MSNKQKWQYPNISQPGKQRPYMKVVSMLDQSNPDSQLNKSNFRGFFNLSAIFGAIFLCTKPFLNFIQNGTLLELTLYNTFKQDFMLCMLVWPLFFLWSFTSFIVQKMILKGLKQKYVIIIQHSTQAGLFIFSTIIILMKDWCATHVAFVILQTCVHFMKMHSYTTVNRDYRLQYLQSIKQNRKALTQYPQNINLNNFIQFMWTPLIVYDKYPRKKTISIIYIVKKSILTVLTILTGYIVHTEYIMPYILVGTDISYIELIFRQMLPSTILILVLFYATFENLVNVFAQISKLDYRQFYNDWWNSTTYEQFNRRWNKPVYNFLYRHVYLESIVKYNKSKAFAQLLTFAVSAVLHEFLLAMMFRTIRPIFLLVIVIQVPVIYMSKSLRKKRLGGYLFWCGIILGPSLIISSYLRVDSSVTNLYSKLQY